MFHEFPKEEIDAVKARFPKLNYISIGAWKGILEFDRVYRDYRIIDSYEIGIAVQSGYPDVFPHVTELQGRALAAAKKHNKNNSLDSHWSREHGACLCVRQEQKIKFPPGSDMVFFIENLVIPYFYGLSYFEEFGSWPWREYAHGGLGLLERHAEETTESTKESLRAILPIFRDDLKNWRKFRAQFMEPRGNRACICELGLPISDCHPLAWTGIVKFHNDLKRLGLNPYKFFSRPVRNITLKNPE